MYIYIKEHTSTWRTGEDSYHAGETHGVINQKSFISSHKIGRRKL